MTETETEMDWIMCHGMTKEGRSVIVNVFVIKMNTVRMRQSLTEMGGSRKKGRSKVRYLKGFMWRKIKG